MRYSRLASVEEKRNMRRAFIFTILTILAILGVLFYGLPSVARFAAFLSDLRKSSLPVDRNDTTPPAPPRLDRLPEATKEPEIEISGVTEEGATVILTLNGKDEEVVADADGKFRFSYSLRKGENQISAKAKDRTGNESQPTAGITVLFDNEAPKLDISAPADGSQFYGDGQRQLAIKGTTEVGITLTINDRIVKVEEDGTFTFATTLADGENSFNLKSADKAGNQTEKTLKVNFSP
ncbi:MAG: Polymorphic outer membrane protein [Candidatus Woesebacteria bacterium GW2011_GWC2_47_16]|uniref:Polymorphic outer membrane protein n=1 Tax=Candidatus Woesebacteria bacterium GW2011_GWC2_47_16 TaxID=1618590 RepID=A0A0G1S1A6_9BACT|nr:MAG: Polymorphic outer membrane protein [Candidatus Woesebacteria bacterium GW2011_GWC2_47_16]